MSEDNTTNTNIEETEKPVMATTKKVNTAKDLNIKVISQKDLMEMLNKTS